MTSSESLITIYDPFDRGFEFSILTSARIKEFTLSLDNFHSQS